MEDIFIKNLPVLDLHGYDTLSAVVAIEDFINDNITLKQDKIVLIHGKGTGKIRNTVNETLTKNKKVLNHHIYSQNSGITIAYLIVDNQ